MSSGSSNSWSAYVNFTHFAHSSEKLKDTTILEVRVPRDAGAEDVGRWLCSLLWLSVPIVRRIRSVERVVTGFLSSGVKSSGWNSPSRAPSPKRMYWWERFLSLAVFIRPEVELSLSTSNELDDWREESTLLGLGTWDLCLPYILRAGLRGAINTFGWRASKGSTGLDKEGWTIEVVGSSTKVLGRGTITWACYWGPDIFSQNWSFSFSTGMSPTPCLPLG